MTKFSQNQLKKGADDAAPVVVCLTRMRAAPPLSHCCHIVRLLPLVSGSCTHPAQAASPSSLTFVHLVRHSSFLPSPIHDNSITPPGPSTWLSCSNHTQHAGPQVALDRHRQMILQCDLHISIIACSVSPLPRTSLCPACTPPSSSPAKHLTAERHGVPAERHTPVRLARTVRQMPGAQWAVYFVRHGDVSPACQHPVCRLNLRCQKSVAQAGRPTGKPRKAVRCC